MFNKHSQGGNVGKPQDPHRLPQLTPHISKVCLPHGGEPRHIRISSNFPSACNDLIPQKLRVYRRNGCSLGLGNPQQSISSKSYWKKNCYGRSHNLRLCVLESLKWTTCRWRIPVFGTVARVLFSYFSRNSMEFLKHACWIHKNLGQVISATFHPIP